MFPVTKYVSNTHLILPKVIKHGSLSFISSPETFIGTEFLLSTEFHRTSANLENPGSSQYFSQKQSQAKPNPTAPTFPNFLLIFPIACSSFSMSLFNLYLVITHFSDLLYCTRSLWLQNLLQLIFLVEKLMFSVFLLLQKPSRFFKSFNPLGQWNEV